jgi:uncharacterized protein (DUF58 family)
MFASALIGMDIRRTVIYQAFSFLFILIVISFVWSLFFRIRLTATRLLPQFGTAGERLEYRTIVRNNTAKPQKGLLLLDNIEASPPTVEEFLYTPEPGEEKRNAYDRTILLYRWNWLISMKKGADAQEQPLPELPPKGVVEVKVAMTPRRRGYIQLTELTIVRLDPLNLCKSFSRIPNRESLLILPKRYEIPAIQLPGSRKFKLGGVTLASSVGDSEEFVSLRDYRPGDPLRRIHWRSWAKTGKPIVKEYHDEYFVRHALVLDTFQKAMYSDMFEEAVSVAASFVYTIRTQDSLLDLLFIGTEAYCFTIGRGLGQTEQMLEILASVTPCQDKSFSELPPLVIERASMLSGCICILLAWDEERQNFIKALRRLGVPILLFILTDGNIPESFDPGPMQDHPENFHVLKVGEIQEKLTQL